MATKDPAAEFMKKSSFTRLTRFVPRHLADLTGGRRGGYHLSPRGKARAVDAATQLGAADGRVLDRYTTATSGPCANVIGQFSRVFVFELANRAASLIGRLKSGVLRAQVSLGAKAAATIGVLVGAVLLIETIFGQPLASRVGPGGEVISYIVSAGLGVLLMLAAHTAVHATPPGVRAQVRSRLRHGSIGALAIFILVAAYLRKFPPTSEEYTTPPAEGRGPNSFDLWALVGPACLFIAMATLMVVTFCVAGLAFLRYEEQLSQVDPKGTQFLIADLRLKGFLASVYGLKAAAIPLGEQFAAAYMKGLLSAVPADLADRLEPPQLTVPGPVFTERGPWQALPSSDS